MLKSNTTTTKRKKNYELNNFLFLSTLSLARTLICVLIYIIYFLFTMKIWYCLDKCQFFSDYLTSNIICLDSAASPAPLMSGPLQKTSITYVSLQQEQLVFILSGPIQPRSQSAHLVTFLSYQKSELIQLEKICWYIPHKWDMYHIKTQFWLTFSLFQKELENRQPN